MNGFIGRDYKAKRDEVHSVFNLLYREELVDKIEHLESLSKLKFTEEERLKFEKEFGDVLDFVNQIASLKLPDDLDSDKPIKLQELRSDEPHQSMDRDEVLQNAPKQKDGCYSTPLVVE